MLFVIVYWHALEAVAKERVTRRVKFETERASDMPFGVESGASENALMTVIIESSQGNSHAKIPMTAAFRSAR